MQECNKNCKAPLSNSGIRHLLRIAAVEFFQAESDQLQHLEHAECAVSYPNSGSCNLITCVSGTVMQM